MANSGVSGRLGGKFGSLGEGSVADLEGFGGKFGSLGRLALVADSGGVVADSGGLGRLGGRSGGCGGRFGHPFLRDSSCGGRFGHFPTFCSRFGHFGKMDPSTGGLEAEIKKKL